jgi:dTDP-D-glucose 4,6-dehydratase
MWLCKGLSVKIATTPERRFAMTNEDCDKAHAGLNWHSVLTIDECLQMTATWYKKFYEAKPQESMYESCTKQIAEYVESAGKRNLIWTKGMQT